MNILIFRKVYISILFPFEMEILGKPQTPKRPRFGRSRTQITLP